MFKKRILGLVICAGGLLGLHAGTSRGAVVSWGAATNISGNSDVSTAGTLVGAFNLGADGVPQKTVNGVTFAPFAFAAPTTTVGNFQITQFAIVESYNAKFGSSVGPFSGLGADYQGLLQSGVIGNQGQFTLTMSGLTVGNTYLFEWWSNDSLLDFRRYTTNGAGVSSGESVGLNDNTTNVGGGLGQFAIGTFKADSTSQSIMFSGAVEFPLVNAFQLRVVPLPAAAWSGLATLLGLGGVSVVRRRTRRS